MRTCREWLPLQLKEGADNQEEIGGGVERVGWGEDAEGAEGVGVGSRQGRSGKLSIGTLQIKM